MEGGGTVWTLTSIIYRHLLSPYCPVLLFTDPIYVLTFEDAERGGFALHPLGITSSTLVSPGGARSTNLTWCSSMLPPDQGWGVFHINQFYLHIHDSTLSTIVVYLHIYRYTYVPIPIIGSICNTYNLQYIIYLFIYINIIIIPMSLTIF